MEFILKFITLMQIQPKFIVNIKLESIFLQNNSIVKTIQPSNCSELKITKVTKIFVFKD